MDAHPGAHVSLLRCRAELMRVQGEPRPLSRPWPGSNQSPAPTRSKLGLVPLAKSN
jgi:hypothetical protein